MKVVRVGSGGMRDTKYRKTINTESAHLSAGGTNEVDVFANNHIPC